MIHCKLQLNSKILSGILGKDTFDDLDDFQKSLEKSVLANRGSMPTALSYTSKTGDFQKVKFARFFLTEEGITVEVRLPNPDNGLTVKQLLAGTNNEGVVKSHSIIIPNKKTETGFEPDLDTLTTLWLGNFFVPSTKEEIKSFLENDLPKIMDSYLEYITKYKRALDQESPAFINSIIGENGIWDSYNSLLTSLGGEVNTKTLDAFNLTKFKISELLKGRVEPVLLEQYVDYSLKVEEYKALDTVALVKEPIKGQVFKSFASPIEVERGDNIEVARQLFVKAIGEEVAKGLAHDFRVKLINGSVELAQPLLPGNKSLTLQQVLGSKDKAVVAIVQRKENGVWKDVMIESTSSFNMISLGKKVKLTTDVSKAHKFKHFVGEEEKQSPYLYLQVENKEIKDNARRSIEQGKPPVFLLKDRGVGLDGNYENLIARGFSVADIFIPQTGQWRGVPKLVDEQGREELIDVGSLVEGEEMFEDIKNLIDHDYNNLSEVSQVVQFLNSVASVGDFTTPVGVVDKQSDLSQPIAISKRSISFHPVQQGEKFVIGVTVERVKDGRQFKLIPKIDQKQTFGYSTLVKGGLESARINIPKDFKEDKVGTYPQRFKIVEGKLTKVTWSLKEQHEFIGSKIKTRLTKVNNQGIRAEGYLFTGTENVFTTEPEISFTTRTKGKLIGSLEVFEGNEFTSTQLKDNLKGEKLSESNNLLYITILNHSKEQTIRFASDAEMDAIFPGTVAALHLGKIYLRLSALNNNTKQLFLEELVHVFTKDALEETEVIASAEYKELDKLREFIRDNNKDEESQYYTQNMDEFVTSVTRPKMVEILKGLEGTYKYDNTSNESLIEHVRALLDSLFSFFTDFFAKKDPSLLDQVTVDILKVGLRQVTEQRAIEKVLTPGEVTEGEVKPKKVNKFAPNKTTLRSFETVKTTFKTPVDHFDMLVSEMLWDSGSFTNFVLGNVPKQLLVNELYKVLEKDYESYPTPNERTKYLGYILTNSEEVFKDWFANSKLFKFSDIGVSFENEEMGNEVETDEEGSNYQERTEQTISSIDQGSKYARVFFKMIPAVDVEDGQIKRDENGQLILKRDSDGNLVAADYTSLWNTVADMTAGALTVDEMKTKLSEKFAKLPEVEIVASRLGVIGNNVDEDGNKLGATYDDVLVLKGIEKSFAKYLVPTLIISATPIVTDSYDSSFSYSVHESGRLDEVNISNFITSSFRKFAEERGFVQGGFLDVSELYNYLKGKVRYSGVAGKEEITNDSLISIWEDFGLKLPASLSTSPMMKAKLMNILRTFTANLLKETELFDGYTALETANTTFDLFKFVSNSQEVIPNGDVKTKPYSASARNLTSILADVLPFSTSNMTKNAEGENQSNLHNFSSWLIYIKYINDYASNNFDLLKEKIGRLSNPIAKYSLALQAAKMGKMIEPLNLSGTVYNTADDKGMNTINLPPIEYVRQEMTTLLFKGVKENIRAETASSSFGFRIQYGDYGVNLPLGKTNQREKAKEVYLNYFRGELERMFLERTNPVKYDFKYNAQKLGFTFFDGILSESKGRFLASVNAMTDVSEIETLLSKSEVIEVFNKDLNNYFNKEVQDFKDWIKQESGETLTKNHPVFLSTQLEKKIEKEGLDKVLDSFILNGLTMGIEEIILFHGEIGQFDKFYKRSKSTISNGTPAIISEVTQEAIKNKAKGLTFSEAYGVRPIYYNDASTLDSVVLTEDKMSISPEQKDNLLTGVLASLKATSEFFGTNKESEKIEKEASKFLDAYKNSDVPDGDAYVHPDAYRLLSISVDSWSLDKEEGYQYLAIKFKEKQGHILDQDDLNHVKMVEEKIADKGYYFQFPKLKFQYRGNATSKSNHNVAVELLDKFALVPLFPEFIEDKPVAMEMFERWSKQGIAYGKHSSGTKIGSFLPDSFQDLVKGINEGTLTPDQEFTSLHTVKTEFLKEQVKTPDKLKNKSIFGSQVRKLMLSNLSVAGKFMAEILPFANLWKSSQAEIAASAKRQLMEDLGAEFIKYDPELPAGYTKIDLNKLVELTKKEIETRDIPEAYRYVFDNFTPDTNLEESLSPQAVETLIYSLLKNRIVKVKFPGSQMVQVSSSLFSNTQEKPVDHTIPMNFEDGTGGRKMREEFKGKSTLQLIKEGKRTATSRDRSKAYNQQDIKEGDIITFYADQGKSKDESVTVRVTKAPYKLEEVTAEQWSQLEGWSPDRYETLKTQGYEQFQFEVIKNSNRDLEFYRIKDGKVLPADAKVTLTADFLHLLNLPEVKLAGGNLKALNTLLKDDEFREKYKRQLTFLSYRIPTQGFNSMDIFMVKEFIPGYMGNTIIPPPQIVTKSGTDYDYDKLLTIFPSIDKDGQMKKDGDYIHYNNTIEAAKGILLAPINFHRLITPNTTDDIVKSLESVLQPLYGVEQGVRVNQEPMKTSVFSYATHLRKWKAVKIKDLLGIGAVANTFYTLMQVADFKTNEKIVINNIAFEFSLPLLSEEEQKTTNIADPFIVGSNLDKLEVINQFINLTVDAASDDIAGYTNMIKDNTGLFMFQVMNGVHPTRFLKFIHQPVIYKYHQIVARETAKGVSKSEAQKTAINSILGVAIESYLEREQMTIPRSAEKIWADIRDIGYPKSMVFNNVTALKDMNPNKESSFAEKQTLVYYLVALKQADALVELQGYLNFDTKTLPSFKMEDMREKHINKINETYLFGEGNNKNGSADRIKRDSVISHLNVHPEFKILAENAFSIKNDKQFVQKITSKGAKVYQNLDRFVRVVDADWLMYVVQNFGDYTQDTREHILGLLKEGKLINQWLELQTKYPHLKDTLLSKKLVGDPSTMSDLVSPYLFMGLDNSSEDFNKIANEIRELLKDNFEIQEWANDLLLVGFYQTGYNQSKLYMLKAFPAEEIEKFTKKAFENYLVATQNNRQKASSEVEKFWDKFLDNRIVEFGKFFRKEYGEGDAFDNLKRGFVKDTSRLFNYRNIISSQEVTSTVEDEAKVVNGINISTKALDEIRTSNRKQAFSEAEKVINTRQKDPSQWTREDWIADTLKVSKVTSKSFGRDYDKNLLKEKMNYVNNKTGSSLDVIAEDLSNRAGYEISVLDVVSFIDAYKSVTDYWLNQQQWVMDSILAELNSQVSPTSEEKEVDNCSLGGIVDNELPF